MGILDHVCGLSSEQDRVWAQVAGMHPDHAGERLLMVWQAFIDESEKDGPSRPRRAVTEPFG